MTDTDDAWRAIRELRQRIVLLERAVESLQKQAADTAGDEDKS